MKSTRMKHVCTLIQDEAWAHMGRVDEVVAGIGVVLEPVRIRRRVVVDDVHQQQQAQATVSLGGVGKRHHVGKLLLYSPKLSGK